VETSLSPLSGIWAISFIVGTRYGGLSVFTAEVQDGAGNGRSPTPTAFVALLDFDFTLGVMGWNSVTKFDFLGLMREGDPSGEQSTDCLIDTINGMTQGS
jgi:hypothetical protein